VAPLYNRLIADGKRIMAHKIEPGMMIPCGVPQEYEELRASLKG